MSDTPVDRTADEQPQTARARLTPAEHEEMMRAAAQWINDGHEMLTGTGAHADHERRQVGRCVYCSCGKRVQGRLPRG